MSQKAVRCCNVCTFQKLCSIVWHYATMFVTINLFFLFRMVHAWNCFITGPRQVINWVLLTFFGFILECYLVSYDVVLMCVATPGSHAQFVFMCCCFLYCIHNRWPHSRQFNVLQSNLQIKIIGKCKTMWVYKFCEGGFLCALTAMNIC